MKRLAKKMYPYVRVLPLAEQELWPPTNRDDIVERRIREVEEYLRRVPVLTFKLSNVPARIKLMVEYEKNADISPAKVVVEYDKGNIKQVSLLFDYVMGKHKAVSIDMKELIPLPDLLGVRILYTIPKKYNEEIEKIFGRDIDGVGGEYYELAGLVEFYDRPVYFIKPDFLTWEQKEKKSPRRIPFKFGFVRLVLAVEHADGTVDRIKLGEAEVFWIRHQEMCSGVAYIIKKSTKNEKLANKLYRECIEKCNEKARHRDNWALLLLHKRYRDVKTGRWREDWRYKLYNFINTNAYPLKNHVRFGNQSFEIVDCRKYRIIIEEDLGARVEWKLEPYAHEFKAWPVKIRAKKKGKGDIVIKPFRVYRLKSPYSDEDWYLFVPEAEITRILVENKHHWKEGWGRFFVELRKGKERVDALLVRHKKLYPKLEASF